MKWRKKKELPDFKRYKPKAQHPDYQACFEKAFDLAQKILPNIFTDKDLSAKDRAENIYRKASSLKKTAENLIENRKRFKNGDHALRPLYVIWTLLNACNFRCSYCDNHQGEKYFDIPDPGRLGTEEGKRLLDMMITGTPALYWCGGEPTMRKDLPELLDYAWHKGYFPNMINTNGSLFHKQLAKPEWSRFLRQMDMIIVSLDGLDLPRLKKLWGVKHPEQVVTNILLLRELQRHVSFKLAVNTVITPETIDEARDVLNLTADLDIWFVPVMVNVKHEPNRAMLENRDYRALVELILERKKKGQKIIGSTRMLKQMLSAEPYMCLTALKPHVWSNGHIAWPCRATVNTEPADINLLDYESFDQAYRAGSRLVNPNFFHGPAKNQCGGNCAWAQNYTTARYLEGIVDPLRSGLMQDIYEFAFGA